MLSDREVDLIGLVHKRAQTLVCLTGKEINTLARLKKRGKEVQWYVFLYDNANRTEIVRLLYRFALTPGLGFTRRDARALSRRIREETEKRSKKRTSKKRRPKRF